jgi:hypothetical protein
VDNQRNSLPGFVRRAAANVLPGVASSEHGVVVTTLFVPGPRSWKIATYWAFSHFPFWEQHAAKFCSTPLNRRSAAHRRNTKMETIEGPSPITQAVSKTTQHLVLISNKNADNIACCLYAANIVWTASGSGRVRPPSGRECAAWRGVQRTRCGSHDSLRARPPIMENSEILGFYAFSLLGATRCEVLLHTAQSPVRRASPEYQDGRIAPTPSCKTRRRDRGRVRQEKQGHFAVSGFSPRCSAKDNASLVGFVRRAAANVLPGVASSEHGVVVTTLFVPGPRSWKIAKYRAFTHFPFWEQHAAKFCSTPLNLRSAAHRRNTQAAGIISTTSATPAMP